MKYSKYTSQMLSTLRTLHALRYAVLHFFLHSTAYIVRQL